MNFFDLETVIAIAQASPTTPQWSYADYVAALGETGTRRRTCNVLTVSGETVGFVVANLLVPEAEIESIAVLPKLQRQGFGSLLLGTALQILARAGATTVHLEVRASNQAARALYRREGFEETGRRPGYYAHPVEDAVLLRRSLAGFPTDSLRSGYPQLG